MYPGEEEGEEGVPRLYTTPVPRAIAWQACPGTLYTPWVHPARHRSMLNTVLRSPAGF